MRSLCGFCGSSTGQDLAYAEAARALGRTLAGEKVRLVFGGGHVGLMGEVANAALAAGGEAVGVTVFDHMVDRGFLSEANRGLVLVEGDPGALLARFEQYRPPETFKWAGRSKT